MGEREAKKIASEMLRPMNQGLEIYRFSYAVWSVHRDNLQGHRVAFAGKLGAKDLHPNLEETFAATLCQHAACGT